MNFILPFFGLTIILLLNFFFIRGMIRVVIDYCLNKSNRKKRRNGQNFMEWFFYKHFKDVVPKIMLVWYYANFVLYFILIIITAILNFLQLSYYAGSSMILVYMILACIPLAIVEIMFFDPKYPGKMNPGRVIERKKRNKK